MPKETAVPTNSNEEPVDKLTEAKKLLEEADLAKQKEFTQKVEALCNEYGLDIKVQSQLVVIKR